MMAEKHPESGDRNQDDETIASYIEVKTSDIEFKGNVKDTEGQGEHRKDNDQLHSTPKAGMSEHAYSRDRRYDRESDRDYRPRIGRDEPWGMDRQQDRGDVRSVGGTNTWRDGRGKRYER